MNKKMIAEGEKRIEILQKWDFGKRSRCTGIKERLAFQNLWKCSDNLQELHSHLMKMKN